MERIQECLQPCAIRWQWSGIRVIAGQHSEVVQGQQLRRQGDGLLAARGSWAFSTSTALSSRRASSAGVIPHLALPQRPGHHVPAGTNQCSDVLLTHHHQVHPHGDARGP